MLPAMSATLDRRALLAAERGTLYKEAETRIALMYPSPYRAAMSSLGYQQIYRVLHGIPGVAADRAMLLEGPDAARGPFVTLEQGRPVGGYPMLAYSVAYELEIAGVVETLERASVAVLVDVVILGEGEELIVELVMIARDVGFDRERVWAALAGRPGYYLPHVHGERGPPVAAAADALLRGRSVIATPHTELADMFMTEAARGCSRGCTYCVMRRSTNQGMRIVPRQNSPAGIPEARPRA